MTVSRSSEIVAGGAAGTVTSVSVVTANGVSGSVATSTTTPAITLTLGDITPSSVTVSGLTASRAVVTDGSKVLTSATTTATEIGYVNGVTSAIQTQLNSKAASGANADITSMSALTGSISAPTTIVFAASTTAALRTNQNLTNALLLQARDVDGGVYTTFITLTAANTPTCDLASAVTLGGNAIATSANNLSFFSGTTSAQFASVISDETGTGVVVFATSPQLTTPTLGVAAATSINFGGGALSVYQPITTYAPTVTLVGGAGNAVPVYTTNYGGHETIGNFTHLIVLLDADGGTEGAGSGQINIALPIAASASQQNGYYSVGFYQNNAAYVGALAQIAASATTIALYRIAAGVLTAVLGSDQNNSNRQIRLDLWYRTTG